MGHEVDLLFGTDIPTGVYTEVAFFEQLQTERGYRRQEFFGPA